VADKADNPPLRILLTAKGVAELDALALAVELPAAGDGNCFSTVVGTRLLRNGVAHPLVQAPVVLQLAEHEERYAPHALKTLVLRLLEMTKELEFSNKCWRSLPRRAASSFASAAAASSSSSAALAVHLSTISSAALTSAAFSSGNSAELPFHSSLASATPAAVSSVALSFAAPSFWSAAAIALPHPLRSQEAAGRRLLLSQVAHLDTASSAEARRQMSKLGLAREQSQPIEGGAVDAIGDAAVGDLSLLFNGSHYNCSNTLAPLLPQSCESQR